MTADACSTARFGDASAGPRRGLVAVWILWASLLAAAMAIGKFGAGHGSAAATAARMGSSVALVVAGWLAYAWWRNTPWGFYTFCIAAGMTLGTIGDFFNAGLLKFIPLPDPVLGGIIAFALGHVAYITGCLNLARVSGLTNRRALIGAVIVWQLVGLAGWYIVAFEGSEKRPLVWPALPYSLLLAATAGLTSGLARQDRRMSGLALGGALFLASDLILACGLFRGHVPHQTEWVWMTYGPGQMLIVYSVVSAAAVVSRVAASIRRGPAHFG